MRPLHELAADFLNRIAPALDTPREPAKPARWHCECGWAGTKYELGSFCFCPSCGSTALIEQNEK